MDTWTSCSQATAEDKEPEAQNKTVAQTYHHIPAACLISQMSSGHPLLSSLISDPFQPSPALLHSRTPADLHEPRAPVRHRPAPVTVCMAATDEGQIICPNVRAWESCDAEGGRLPFCPSEGFYVFVSGGPGIHPFSRCQLARSVLWTNYRRDEQRQTQRAQQQMIYLHVADRLF